MAQLVDGVTHCRFEATDSTRDEVVLLKILQLQLACLRSPSSRFLAEEALWSMIHICFRIHRQVRGRALLLELKFTFRVTPCYAVHTHVLLVRCRRAR